METKLNRYNSEKEEKEKEQEDYLHPENPDEND